MPFRPTLTDGLALSMNTPILSNIETAVNKILNVFLWTKQNEENLGNVFRIPKAMILNELCRFGDPGAVSDFKR